MTERIRPDAPPGGGFPGAASSGVEPSISDLMSHALEQVRALVRGELRLARREAERKLKQAGIGLALLVGALVLGLAVVVMVLVTLMAILAALGVPVWLSALLATLIGAGGAAGLAWLGLQRLKADALLPQRTLRQLQKDRLAVKEQIR